MDQQPVPQPPHALVQSVQQALIAPFFNLDQFDLPSWMTFVSSFESYRARGGSSTMATLVSASILDFVACTNTGGFSVQDLANGDNLQKSINAIFAPRSREEARQRLSSVKMSHPMAVSSYSRFVMDFAASEKTIPAEILPGPKTRMEIFLGGLTSQVLRDELKALELEDPVELRRQGLKIVSELVESADRSRRLRGGKQVEDTKSSSPMSYGAKPKQARSAPKKTRADVTCYRCGLEGHYSNECTLPPPAVRAVTTPPSQRVERGAPEARVPSGVPQVQMPTPRRFEPPSASQRVGPFTRSQAKPKVNSILAPTIQWTPHLPKKTFDVFPLKSSADSIRLRALLDTGASINTVDSHAAKKLLRHGASSYKVDVPIALGGTSLEQRSNQMIDIYIADQLVQVLVVTASTYPMILGYSTLKALNLVQLKTESDEQSTDILTDLLEEFSDLFDENLSSAASVAPFKIDLLDPNVKLPNAKPRRLPLGLQEKVREQIDSWLGDGIIEPSDSSTSSPVVMVRKKTGDFRLCVDYRELNRMTRPIPYPMQNIGAILERLSGSKFFSKLDLSSGFLQVPMDPASAHLTAFSTPDGLYQFKRMPFGLTNAPLHFQKVMNRVLESLHHQSLEVYMDDTLVHASSMDAMIGTLRQVFELLRAEGLKLKKSKCQFGVTEIEFLGHLLDGEGLKVSPSRIEALMNVPMPSTLKQLRSFLGAANYLRNYIRDFSVVAGPLYGMLGSMKGHGNSPLGTWSIQEQQAWTELRKRIVETPTLHFLNPNRTIYLECDASDRGVGAVLFQLDDKGHGLSDSDNSGADANKKIIAFVSKAFKGPSTRWSTTEKEAFAVYYAVRALKHYLMGIRFVVRTDHRNLLFVKNSDVPKVERWQVKLQDYDYEVEHIPGSENKIADALSRICTIDADPASLDAMGWISSIGQYHNAVNGHHGVHRTVRMMKEAGFSGKGIWKAVKSFVSECPICQKGRKGAIPFPVELRTSMSEAPFEVISMDLVGPLVQDVKGNQYVLTLVDNFSRFTLLKALPDKTGATVAEAVLGLLGNFGILPKTIRSDHGSEFTAESSKQLFDTLKIQHQLTVTDHPSSNGLVERRNAEVVRHLRNFANENNAHSNWGQCLPLIQRIINVTVCDTTGLSPFEILFGDYAPTGYSFLPVRDDGKSTDPPSRWRFLIESQKKALASARLSQEKYLTKYLAGSPAEPTVLKPGDLVLAIHRGDHAPSKLSPRLRGPYKIQERLGTNRYLAEHLYTKGTIDVHLEHLRPFEGNLTTALEAAKQDGLMSEYLVERIVKHKFQGRRRCLQAIRFLIRWDGWGSDYDSWKSYRDVSELKALDLYLEDNPELRSIVPFELDAAAPLKEGSVATLRTRSCPSVQQRRRSGLLALPMGFMPPREEPV